MKLYSNNDSYKLYQGNMLDMLNVIEPNSIDSIVTDPPYGLTSITKRYGKKNSVPVTTKNNDGSFTRLTKGFMGKEWDGSGIEYNIETWKKCYEVLKDGGYLLAFGGSRTFHRIACAIEDAGFEIRDTIMWLYGSGFPKSMDISKQLDKRNGKQNEDFTKFGNYVKQCREAKGYSKNDIDKIIGTNTACAWWEGRNYLGDFIVQLPDKENYYKLKEILDMNNDFDYLIEWQEAEREVIGEKIDNDGKPRSARLVNKCKNASAWNLLDTDEKLKKATYKTAPSTDLAKRWSGWGTALKPSFEPIIVARKPFKGSLVDNVIKNGVGGINIDECRVGNEERQNPQAGFIRRGRTDEEVFMGTDKNRPKGTLTVNGRFPANTILTYDETDFEEVCGGFPNTKSTYNSETKHENIIHRDNADFLKYGYKSRIDSSSYNDSGNASRYFYCAKASKKDRDEGLEEFEEKEVRVLNATNPELEQKDDVSARFITVKKNIHPTVKPTSLMQYLVRLVTPNNGIILDPFNGSGSTGKAVMYENKERNKNYKYIGIEMTEEYLPISKARIEYVYNQIKDSKVQISIDDME